MIGRMASLAAGVVILAAATCAAAEPAKPETDKTVEKVTAAVAAAEKWLALTDLGDYAQAWKDGAEYLKGAVKQEAFAQALQGARKPLGKMVSRKVKTKTYKTSLPGAPDGEYVIVEFESSFENKKEAVETLTPTLDKDGTWRVSGYFIK